MPIYEYRCPECGHEQEAILSFSEAAVVQLCSECGKPTEHRISLPQPAIVPVGGRESVLKTLNKEEGGYTFPGGDMHRPRYEQAMAKGLDQHRPVIGRGFG